MIPAGTAHELDPQMGWCAVIYSDIYAPYWQAMQPTPGLAPLADLANLDAVQHALRKLITPETPEAELINDLGAALEHSLGTPPRQFNRMQLALRHQLREQDDLNLNELAAAMQLSPSRVQHLFLNELGVSYKRVQHWVRFRAAMRKLGNTGSLTEAALDGGFSDSSHFSNAFKTMFGVSARDAGIAGRGFRLWQSPW
ncbi:MAG: AraC family transcriptional regulator [Oceanococcaceae bacterium]